MGILAARLPSVADTRLPAVTSSLATRYPVTRSHHLTSPSLSALICKLLITMVLRVLVSEGIGKIEQNNPQKALSTVPGNLKMINFYYCCVQSRSNLQ